MTLPIKDGNGAAVDLHSLTDAGEEYPQQIVTKIDPNGDYQDGRVSGTSDSNSSDVTLGVSATFNGTYVSLAGFASLSVSVDGTSAGTADGTLTMSFSHDGVTSVRDIIIAVSDVSATPPRTLGTVAEFFKVTYANGTTATTSFSLQTILHTETVGLISRLDQTLDDNTDVQNTRSVLMGKDSNGDYQNASVVETVNDDGTTYNLQVVSGARPSQLPGRLPVEIVIDSSASSLEYTVTSLKTLYITDMIMTITNTDTGGEGKLIIRDGTTIAGTVKLPIGVVESANSTSGLTTITMTFAEPLAFSTGVFFEENDGTLLMVGNLNGYEE